jgi:UDP-N-acetylmuramate dehydrogenase
MTLIIQENIPLAPLTTFQIGGPARYFVDVRSDSDIQDAIAWAKEKSARFVVLAGGSNVLVPDEGIDALVIHPVGNLYGFAGDTLDAWGATNLLFAIKAIGTQGYGGWEKLAGIPGTIGGAVRGNAGAFGSEVKDFVVTVRALNTLTGEIRDFSAAECGFSYRHSYFKDHPEWFIMRAVLKLSTVEPSESARLADETIAEREKRHLQNVRAAGSFFTNPVAPQHIVDMFEAEKGVKSRENRVPAGWLIEKAGLKGHKVGDARCSPQHADYIINTGNATAHDVRNLAQMIKLEVSAQFGVELTEEAALL